MKNIKSKRNLINLDLENGKVREIYGSGGTEALTDLQYTQEGRLSDKLISLNDFGGAAQEAQSEGAFQMEETGTYQDRREPS